MCVPASLFCRLETPRIRYTARLGWSGVHVLHAVSCLSVCRCCLDAPVHLHGGRASSEARLCTRFCSRGRADRLSSVDRVLVVTGGPCPLVVFLLMLPRRTCPSAAVLARRTLLMVLCCLMWFVCSSAAAVLLFFPALVEKLHQIWPFCMPPWCRGLFHQVWLTCSWPSVSCLLTGRCCCLVSPVQLHRVWLDKIAKG